MDSDSPPDSPLRWGSPSSAARKLAASIGDPNKLQRACEQKIVSRLINCLSDTDSDRPLQKYVAETLKNLTASNSCIQEEMIYGLQSLVKSLFRDDRTELRQSAVETLRNLAAAGNPFWNRRIINQGGVLLGLVKTLREDGSSELQQRAAETLGHLGNPNCTEWNDRDKVLQEKGALTGLVKALGELDEVGLQEKAVMAIMNYIPYGAQCNGRLMIVDEPGALKGLVMLLSARGNPLLQASGAWILFKLSKSYDPEIQLAILNQAGVLPGLLKAMSDKDNPLLQKKTAKIVRNLANGDDEIVAETYINKDGLLGALVHTLSSKGNHQLQKCALKTLENLVLAGGVADEVIKRRLVDEDGLLASLIKILDPESHALEECETFAPESLGLSHSAATVLSNLAGTEDDLLRIRIQNERGALNAITNALTSYDSPPLRETAATILRNLACAEDVSIQQNIAQEQSVIFGLVDCLSADEANVKEAAASALAALADAQDVSVSRNLVTEFSVGDWKFNPLSKFVDCFSAGSSRLSRETVAKLLASLARTEDDSIKLKIAAADDMLPILVKCSSDANEPTLQVHAAKALAALASAQDVSVNRNLVTEFSVGDLKFNPLSKFVDCFSAGNSWLLQETVAELLASLACTEDDSIKLKIAAADDMLPILVKCSFDAEKPTLQKHAKKALASLADARDPVIKEQIKGCLDRSKKIRQRES